MGNPTGHGVREGMTTDRLAQIKAFNQTINPASPCIHGELWELIAAVESLTRENELLRRYVPRHDVDRVPHLNNCRCERCLHPMASTAMPGIEVGNVYD